MLLLLMLSVGLRDISITLFYIQMAFKSLWTDTVNHNYSGYATWFTAGGAIRIAHYDVIDDVITRKL